MKVGLRDSGETGQPSFGGFAAAYTAPKVVDEPFPQLVKVIGWLFLREIG